MEGNIISNTSLGWYIAYRLMYGVILMDGCWAQAVWSLFSSNFVSPGWKYPKGLKTHSEGISVFSINFAELSTEINEWDFRLLISKIFDLSIPLISTFLASVCVCRLLGSLFIVRKYNNFEKIKTSKARNFRIIALF